jgi:hypothetical protein
MCMKVSEILVDMLNFASGEASPKPEQRDVKLANSPDPSTLDAKTMFSMGDDVHKPKNPADIRTNAPSMYPGYQAEKK